MKIPALIIGFVLLCHSAVSFAHFGGHGEGEEVELSWNEVISVATQHVGELIKLQVDLKDIGVLDKSWNNVVPSAKKFDRRENGDFIVSFAHPVEKKTLYMLLSPVGDLYEVNFSGNFGTAK